MRVSTRANVLVMMLVAVAGLWNVSCGGLSTAHSTVSAIRPTMGCHYDGRQFIAIYQGRKFTHTAESAAATFAISCGVDVSLLYDGDDMIVFDGPRASFATHIADDRFPAARVSAGRDLAALYDGDDLCVYNGRTARIDCVGVDDNVTLARLDAGIRTAILYDGDSMVAYSAVSGTFERQTADDMVARATVVAGADGAMGYDGETVYGFCAGSRRWITTPADVGVTATPLLDPSNDQPVLAVGDDFFQLSADRCALTRI